MGRQREIGYGHVKNTILLRVANEKISLRNVITLI
jgi:hypothetical protein